MTDEFQTECPGCHARLRVPAAGKFMCPKCGRIFVVDAGAAVAAPTETAPAPPAAGVASCENHPGVPATAICRSCGRLVCASCQAETGGEVVCVACAAREARAPASPGVAWEEPGRPFFHGFGATLIEPLVRPSEFFGAMAPRGNLGRAFLFGFLVRLAVGFVGVFVQALLTQAMFSPESMNKALDLFNTVPALRELGPEFRDALKSLVQPSLGLSLAVGLVTAPLTAAAGLLIESLILHLFLLLFGAGKNGLEATLKVNAYTAFLGVLPLVPFLGAVGYLAWKAVILIVGLAQVHRSTQGKTAAAVLIPPLGCAVLVMFLAALFFVGVIAAIGGMK